MKRKIGTYAFPIDNSQSYTIDDYENNPMLAGTYNTPAKKVLILSLPYKIYISNWHKSAEFVTVMYNGKCHVVLNNFSDIQPFNPDNPIRT